jgi:hypothetical protein
LSQAFAMREWAPKGFLNGVKPWTARDRRLSARLEPSLGGEIGIGCGRKAPSVALVAHFSRPRVRPLFSG